MSGYTKTYTLDFTASGDTVYTGADKLEDNIDDIITWINYLKKNYASATAPTSPAPDEGQLWFDSTNDELHVYNGSSWGDPITDTFKVKADSSDSSEDYLDSKVQNSIVNDATNHKIHLSGDSASPGNNYFYGTSGSGTKGWRVLPYTSVVSSNDTTPGYLNGKLVAGTDITLTEGSDGGDETLTIASDISAGSITQSYLATSTGSVSTTGSDSLTLPGGSYGFYPQIKTDNAAYYCYWGGDVSGNGRAAYTNSTSYVTNIYMEVDAGGTGYAQQRYITSSGEIFWIFLLFNKHTGELKSGFQSPDHPCFGNGGNPAILEHPFPLYDSDKHEIVVVNPTDDQVKQMKSLCKSPKLGIPRKDMLELFYPTRNSSGDIIADPVISLATDELEYPNEEVTVGVVENGDDEPPSGIFYKGSARIIKSKVPQPSYIKVRGIGSIGD